jgi:hypothetical protein
MSQSLLYHAFGVREGYEYWRTEYLRKSNRPCVIWGVRNRVKAKVRISLRFTAPLPHSFYIITRKETIRNWKTRSSGQSSARCRPKAPSSAASA